MSARTLLALGVVASLAAGCPSGPAPMGTDAGGRRCSIDLDCDDMIECTLDSCSVAGTCENLPLDELCGPGESCSPTSGCRSGSSCTSAAECDDGIACTVEQCVAGGTCRITTLDARCSAPTPVCDAMMGCVAESGCYTPMPCTTADECQDGDFCNGAEICTPEFGCAPAPTPRMCADTDDCTIDSCDAAADMCVFACDRSRPECMCPSAGSCEGTFMLTGTPLTYSCYLGRTGFDFTTATFAFDTGDLVITPRALYTPGLSGQSLTDAMDPRCPEFDAEVTFGGGCVEHYRLHGSFSDDDHFSGTLEWWYEKMDGFSCTISACMGRMSTAVTGTRMP